MNVDEDRYRTFNLRKVVLSWKCEAYPHPEIRLREVITSEQSLQGLLYEGPVDVERILIEPEPMPN